MTDKKLLIYKLVQLIEFLDKDEVLLVDSQSDYILSLEESKISIDISYYSKANRSSEAKELVEKAIRHWEEMINWVLQCDLSKKVNMQLMKSQIGITWDSRYCALCEKYLKHDYCDIKCLECPLYQDNNWCADYDSLWKKVSYSETWSEWLYNAKNLLARLQYLLEIMLKK